MANVNSNFLIICDSAFTTEGSGSLNIIGIFDGISAPEFPAMHSRLTVVANMSGDPGEYEARIKIREKSTDEVIAELPSDKKINIREDKKAQYVASFFGLIFKEQGEYIVELYVDGSKRATTNFFVTKS